MHLIDTPTAGRWSSGKLSIESGLIEFRQGPRNFLRISPKQLDALVDAALYLGPPTYPLEGVGAVVRVPRDFDAEVVDGVARLMFEVSHNPVPEVGGWRIIQASSRTFLTADSLAQVKILADGSV